MEVNKIRLNMTEIYKEIGLKSVIDIGFDARDRGKKQALEYIGEKSREGDELAHIERKTNPIPNIALRKTRAPQYGLTMDVVPKTRVRMQIYRASVIDVYA